MGAPVAVGQYRDAAQRRVDVDARVVVVDWCEVQDVVARMASAMRGAATALAAVMRPYGLELRHFAILIVLADRGATMQRELPQLTGFDKAAIGRGVDDLEDAGFGKRVGVPHDRRIWLLDITARGTEVFDEAHVSARSIEAGLVAHLAPGEPEQLLDRLTRYTYPDATV